MLQKTNPSHCTLIENKQIPVNSMSDIMDHDQWQCRNCDRTFETRGRRDYHQRNEHQKFVTTQDLNQQPTQIQRSTSKAFKCPCGKDFLHVQSLQRHTKNCNGTLLTVSSDSEDDHTHGDEGISMRHTNGAELCFKN